MSSAKIGERETSGTADWKDDLKGHHGYIKKRWGSGQKVDRVNLASNVSVSRP